ncbi:LysR family transcriptional regulator [Catelliglobosispora koreensis]|uniref:LysR family transcriptional regulator n=1 Tax=Catelliglobosispora koreensis TaxID=129052 RepID=UPI0003819F12|nr:LysR family transcriptional regulator [Catelliglobosispora koreensis]
MADDLEIRLLRHFVAVAEELHFTRASQRLFVTQQSLSRDIRRLEDHFGVRLFERTSRQVELTAAGQALLTRSRELLSLYATTVREVRGEPSALTVDVVGPGLTPALVLATARQRTPDIEFFARFLTGAQAAMPMLLADQIDVTFGRHVDLADQLPHRIVRYEPLTVLLPQQHELAQLDAVPFESLRDTGLCIRAGNHVTPAWSHAMRQLLAPFGADPESGHPHVQGADELAQHIRDRNAPILTMSSQPDVPAAVMRPVVDPIPLFPWTMIWRPATETPALRSLHGAVDELIATEDWLTIPDNSWLPEPEASRRTHLG